LTLQKQTTAFAGFPVFNDLVTASPTSAKNRLWFLTIYFFFQRVPMYMNDMEDTSRLRWDKLSKTNLFKDD